MDGSNSPKVPKEMIPENNVEKHNQKVKEITNHIVGGALHGTKPLVIRDVGRALVAEGEKQAKAKEQRLPD